MNSLVDQFSASGEFGVGAPFLVVPYPASMPVTAPDKHQFTEGAISQKFMGLSDRRGVSVVESNADQRFGFPAGFQNGLEVPDSSRRGLLDKNMFTRPDSLRSNFRKRVVRGGNNNYLNVVATHYGLPIRGCSCRRGQGCERTRSLEGYIHAGNQSRSTQRLSALAADESAANDRYS